MQSAPEASAAAIIVAAGRGTRLGDAGKILRPLGDRPLLNFSIDAAEAASSVSDIIIVAGPHTIAQINRIVAESNWAKVRHVALGGDRRQDSVEAGLRLVRSHIAVVAVHDAARPFATPGLFDACVAAAFQQGAAIAAMPVADTLKRVSAGVVTETLPRDDLLSRPRYYEARSLMLTLRASK
jgi:2-C-methyl-D-erythritol 4-phosphate cytidylyltransferase